MSRQIDSSLFSFIYIKDIEHSVSDVSSWIASDEFGYFFRNSGRVGIGYHKDGVPPPLLGCRLRQHHNQNLCRVGEAVKWLEKFKAAQIPVAAVATGFPSGQYALETRLEEIRHAIKAGAKEIDIVINRTLALQVKKMEFLNFIKNT